MSRKLLEGYPVGMIPRGGSRVVGGVELDAYSALVLLNTPASILSYLPLDDAFGSTSARDLSGKGRTGVHYHVQTNCVGPVNKAAYFDGHNGIINWYSAGLAGAFSGSAGTLAICARVIDTKMWTNGTPRRIVQMYIDTDNQIMLELYGGSGLYLFGQAIFGGTNKAAFFGDGSSPATGWFHVAVTWDKAADQVKYYLNGVQQGATLTGLGTWVGSIPSNRLTIGGDQAYPLQASYSPENAWGGFLAHAELRNVAMPASYFAAQYALLSQAALPAYKHFAVVGDSISWGLLSAADRGWPYPVLSYLLSNRSSLYLLDNYATGGAVSADGVTFTTKLTASLAAIDTAVCAIGINDFNTHVAVDTFETRLASIITALKALATHVFILNIYPNGSGVLTPALSEYQAKIQAVATAQSVTMIDVSNAYAPGVHCLVDGTHPDDGGHAILAGLIEAAL